MHLSNYLIRSQKFHWWRLRWVSNSWGSSSSCCNGDSSW